MEKMEKDYLIRLKPVDVFFFGGEVTFGGEHEEANYLVKSNPFPQQTTILGTMRKELLIQKGYLKSNRLVASKDQVDQLIGPESFNINSDSIQKFGYLKKISPVFLCQNKNSYFITCPKDSGLEFQKLNGKTNLNLTESKDFIPRLNNFKSKDGPINAFVNPLALEKKYFKDFKDVFRQVEKIGITKGKDGKTDDEAFFKKTSYRLQDGFEFAFILTIDAIEDLSLKDSIVFMGAENSSFIMEIDEINKGVKSFVEIFKPFEKKDKVILLSDAYLKEDIYDYCDFAITETVDFRNIKSTTNQYKFKKANSKRTFIKRGSVFFTDDKTTFIDKCNHNNLMQIGYNITI